MAVEITGHVPSPERIRAAFFAAAVEQMKKATTAIEGSVRSRAPFRTGHLRRSLTSAVSVRDPVITGTIGTTTFYAPYLEMGTGLYGPRHALIVPKNARALRFPAGGSASLFSGGRRMQGSAGPGFRLSGAQRSGTAGAGAGWIFAKSIRGVQPRFYFRDGIMVARPRAVALIQQTPEVAARLLAAGA